MGESETTLSQLVMNMQDSMSILLESDVETKKMLKEIKSSYRLDRKTVEAQAKLKEMDYHEGERTTAIDSTTFEETQDKADQETGEIKELDVDLDLFYDGLDSVAKLMGQIAGLTDVGVEPDVAIEFILEREKLEHEKYLNKETVEHNIEIAKITEERQKNIEEGEIL